MIIYLLLQAIMFILEILATLFGDLIPSFPSTVTNYFPTITQYMRSAWQMVIYFFDSNLVRGLIIIVLAWYAFLFIKDNVMKIVGHFLGN